MVKRNITMENPLNLTENPQPQVTDNEKLKFFTRKISIWDHFSIHEASYKLLSVEEKSALLKRYYVELDSKYYGGKKKTGNLCSFLSEDVYFWLVFVMIFYTLILAIIVLKIILTFFLGTVPTTIDKSVSDATKLSNQISMKKILFCPKSTLRQL